MKNFSLFEKEERIECKPFIKWVGGKGQLLPEINKLYPVELGKTISKYAEIFIGKKNTFLWIMKIEKYITMKKDKNITI